MSNDITFYYKVDGYRKKDNLALTRVRPDIQIRKEPEGLFSLRALGSDGEFKAGIPGIDREWLIALAAECLRAAQEPEKSPFEKECDDLLDQLDKLWA